MSDLNKRISRLVDGDISVEFVNACWLQLKKDMLLAGIGDLPDETPPDLHHMLIVLVSFIKEAKSTNPNWDNLNYRIDIADTMISNPLQPDEYAKSLVYRTAQKVWVRQQISASTKNEH